MNIDLAQIMYGVFAYLPLLVAISFIAPIVLPTIGEVVLWIVGGAILNLLAQIAFGKYSIRFFDTELIEAMPWFIGVAICFGALGACIRWYNGGYYVPEAHPVIEASWLSLDPNDPLHPLNPSNEHYASLRIGSGQSSP